MRAQVAQKKVAGPDGVVSDAFVVTAENGEMTLFSGALASARAVKYARENYGPLDFSVLAETGRLGLRGAQIGVVQ